MPHARFYRAPAFAQLEVNEGGLELRPYSAISFCGLCIAVRKGFRGLRKLLNISPRRH
jgi:hypothetical protein